MRSILTGLTATAVAATATLVVGGGPAAAAPAVTLAKAAAATTVEFTIFGLSGPAKAAVTPDGTHVYVTNANNRTVSMIETSVDRVAATIVMPYAPDTIAVTPDGRQLFVGGSAASAAPVIVDITGQRPALTAQRRTRPTGARPGTAAGAGAAGTTVLCPLLPTNRRAVFCGIAGAQYE